MEFKSATAHLWSPELKWADNFPQLEALWEDANGAVSALHDRPFLPFVDELAILMPNREMVMAFVEDAVQNGWCYFNSSVDTVKSEPMGTVYGVQYHFLRHPGYPWRLEVMLKTSGISPVHDVLWDVAQAGFPVVHASFKPESGESLANYLAESALLHEEGYLLAQECRSTYGAFGYWRKPTNPQAFYLKPRVNLRDALPGARILAKGNYEIDANDPEDVPRRKGAAL